MEENGRGLPSMTTPNGVNINTLNSRTPNPFSHHSIRRLKPVFVWRIYRCCSILDISPAARPTEMERMRYLDETDICGFFSKALTADVEAVFADQTGFVGADAARWFVSLIRFPQRVFLGG